MALQQICETRGIAAPTIISESGRALVAHHSVLVFDVLGVSEATSKTVPDPVRDGDPKVLSDLAEVWENISKKNFQEAYHDSLQLKEEAGTLFSLGYLDLKARARVDRLFWACCERIQRIVRDMPETPEDLEALEKMLADTYFANLSIFQSVPTGRSSSSSPSCPFTDSTSAPPAAASSPTSPATATARSINSSTPTT